MKTPQKSTWLEEFLLCCVQYSQYTGFLFDIISINGRSLFAINASKKFCYMDILFVHFKIFDLTD